MTVYLDLLFLINFSMDYLCLYICARVLKRKIVTLRLILSAAIGGIFSCASLFLPINSIIELVLDALVCVLMCTFVFYEKGRPKSSLFLCSFLYIGISMMSGGCMTAIFNLLDKINLPLDKIEEDGLSAYLFAALAVIAAIISLRSGEIISRTSTVNECTVKINIDGKEQSFFGFVDSGNLVKEAISGKNVIFVDQKKLSAIVDIKILSDFANGELTNYKTYKNMRLISVKTASGTKLAVAFQSDRLSIALNRSEKESINISPDAFIAPIDISEGINGYEAIVPKEILKI